MGVYVDGTKLNQLAIPFTIVKRGHEGTDRLPTGIRSEIRTFSPETSVSELPGLDNPLRTRLPTTYTH